MSERRQDPSNAGNPDPDHMPVTGLEPGGGVPPGETPPGEASTTWQQGHGEGAPKKGFPAVWIGLLGVIVLLVILFFVGNIIGIIEAF